MRNSKVLSSGAVKRPYDVTNWTFVVRALRSRNYRLFFSGQSISLIGTWMTRIATGWLVYRLTGSAVLLGTVSFAGQVPAFFLAPLAGVLVDRWDRHRTLVVTQVVSMLQSFAIAGLALTGLSRSGTSSHSPSFKASSTRSICPRGSPSS